MAVRSTALTVTTTAAQIANPASDSDSNAGYRDIAIRNNSAVTIYLGGPDVDTTNGYNLAPSDGLLFSGITPTSIPYARVATGTAAAAVLEVGV